MTPEQTEQLKILEAMLFASAAPLSTNVMHERLPGEVDLNVLLPELKELYQDRGIHLVEINGQWAFRTTDDVSEALTLEKEVTRKLSKAALETLAIIAYHQPITRAEIENIRGVGTHKGTLDTLMEMGWVKPGRRRETPGRPLTWLTTNDFMDHFQLESMTDLPGLDDLKASGLLDRRPAIDTIPDTGDLFESGDVDAEEVLNEAEEEEGGFDMSLKEDTQEEYDEDADDFSADDLEEEEE